MVTLDDFNNEPADQAVQALRTCNAAPRFAAEIVARRPYPDVETLVRRAEEVVRSLPWDDVTVAMAAHRPADGPAISSEEVLDELDRRVTHDGDGGDHTEVVEQLARTTALRVREMLR